MWIVPSLVAALALRSCVSVGAAASTSWPSKVHGRAVDADGEKEESAPIQPSGDGPIETVPEKPKVHLGLPGVYQRGFAVLLSRATHGLFDGGGASA